MNRCDENAQGKKGHNSLLCCVYGSYNDYV